MRTVRPAVASLVALALAGAGTGCVSDDEAAGGEAATAPKQAGAPKAQTTKVRVVERPAASGRTTGGLDPAGLYRRLSPGVVTILSLFGDGGASLLDEDGGEGGQGSGFVLDGQGYIATNAHVVTTGDPPDFDRAEQVYVEFSSGDRVRAEIVGTDPNADVALLKVDPAGLGLTPLRLARGRELSVGQPVAAIGSPFGEQQSLSVGVISALDRNIESLTDFQIGNAIQTDAAINPGNSGGPLLDAAGRVLGINSQIKSASGGGEGVGFAIPVQAVARSLRGLRANGKVDYGYLGVSSQPLYPQLAERLDVPVETGALVADIVDGSPADDAGLRAGDDDISFQGTTVSAGGDVIVSVDGRRLTRRSDLTDLISAHDVGDEVRLGVLRGGERRTVEVRLGRRPATTPQP